MKRFFIVFGISLALAFAIFGNGIGGEFAFDDKIVIVGHPLISEEFPSVGKIFGDSYHGSQPRTGLYRPLTIFSYAVQYWIFGPTPESFHVVNVIIHALVVALLFFVVRQRASQPVAIIASALFMFLPIHVEDVTSIVGRAELLALLFVLAGLWSANMRRWWLASFALFLGLLSKESAVALIPIVAFEELYLRREHIKTVAKRILPFLVPFGIYLVMRYAALGQYFLTNDATAIYNPLKFTNFFTTLWTSGKILLLYMQKAFIPTWFSIDYSFNQVSLVTNLLHSIPAMVGLSLGVGLIVLAVRKRFSMWGWGAMVFLCSYFVISNLIFKTGTVMAERLLYAPSVGLCVLLALGLWYVAQKFSAQKIVIGCLVILLVWYGYKTIDRNGDWMTEERLFESAYAVAPDSVVNRTNRAYLLYIKKDYEASREEALQVLLIAPDHVPALNLAAQTSKRLGDKKSAEALWTKTIQLRDDYLRGYLGLGVLYYENGFFVKAEEILAKAISVHVRWTEVLYLSLAQTGQKKYDEAIETITRHYGEDPAQVELRFALGIAWYKKGNKERAREYITDDYFPTIEESSIFRVMDL